MIPLGSLIETVPVSSAEITRFRPEGADTVEALPVNDSQLRFSSMVLFAYTGVEPLLILGLV